MKRKFTVNSRLLTDLIPNHITTFSAFCELINNSIQANAKNIWIDIEYADKESISPTAIKKISIRDDGHGVHSSELMAKTLDIGTANKVGGKGIGRFCAFQIGKKFTIKTIGYDQVRKKYSESIIPLSVKQVENAAKIGDLETDTQEEELQGDSFKTGYSVIIEDLYNSTETENGKDRNRRLTQQFLEQNINDAIFERYPLEIFNNKVIFNVNSKTISRDDFIDGDPVKKKIIYHDKKGGSHDVFFSFFKVKNIEDIRVFLTIDNAGIKTVSNSLKYDADWLSPKIKGWYIYVNSEVLSADNYRNIDLDGLDEELSAYKLFIKSILNQFFKEKNKEFDNFTDKLKKDIYYPYRTKEASSKSKELLFDKLAYLVEDKYQLLTNQEKLREIIYPLIDKTIAFGELGNILREILRLDNKLLKQFNALLERTELENVIEFSEKVAIKQQELDFLEKIVYSDISKYVKERKQLHKYLERMLWIFGEEYNQSSRLLSDKNLENNLIKLREECLQYRVSKKDDNEIKITDQKIRSITDLFLYNKRVISADKHEALIVELKAPRVKISQKELNQVMRYAQEIEDRAEFSNNIIYKILLISSDFNKWTDRELKGRKAENKGSNPYFYYRTESGNIEISVMKWADLIENLKRRLNYLSLALKAKDIDVEEKAQKDFADIEFNKVKSSLVRVAN